MSNERTHYVTTNGGVTIGGTVRGDGPPVVLLQGVLGDGDLDWRALLPHLTDRFTCHLPSMRGRGRSAEHPDLSLGRLVDDVLTYVDSIDGPTLLVGWSLGAGVALTAAGTQPDAVDAVVAVGPMMPGLMGEDERAAFGAAVARAGGLAGEGNGVDALRTFAAAVFDGEEIAAVEDAGYIEACARYVPELLRFLQQQREYTGPVPWDPAVLGAISARVLALYGSRTEEASDGAGARFVVDHVPTARMQALPGAGHAAPLTHPAEVAGALVPFFSPVAQAGGRP